MYDHKHQKVTLPEIIHHTLAVKYSVFYLNDRLIQLFHIMCYLIDTWPIKYVIIGNIMHWLMVWLSYTFV